MLVELAILGVATIPVILVMGLLTIMSGLSGWSAVVVQSISSSLVGVGIAMALSVSWYFGLVMGVIALAVNVWAHVNTVRKYSNALNGDYGDEIQWSAELVNEEDTHFIIAYNNLSKTERKEVQIIAESKDEFRTLAIERFEEKSDEPIPENFA